ncbi:MAG: hypothetical protein ACRDNX_04425 [Gaiellaceae bacterium]
MALVGGCGRLREWRRNAGGEIGARRPRARGGFRIPAFSLTIDPATGELGGSGIVPALRTDIFDHWLLIAEQASVESERVHEDAVETPLDDNEGFSKALEREFRASLVAVVSAAFAIEAFYRSVLEHAPETRVEAGTQDARIFETLKRAFALPAAQHRAIRENIRVIFRLRDQAVHPHATWVKPVRHPVFNVGMEPRFVNYRAEHAVNALLLARKVIAFCLRKPKPKYVDLVAWCEPLKDLVPEPSQRASA